MTDVYVGSDDSARSDAELILDVRGGDLEAFGALYTRHVPAARAVARQYVRSPSDADDLVSEAFHRVLEVLQHGGGPDATFRAYLLTVVRRLAADLARGVKRTRPTADDGTFEAALGLVDPTDVSTFEGFEHSVVKNAYQALPERWQAVLWYTEIEGRTPAEVAPVLGLTPNGVSALAYRAREGLRVGYLQEHLTHAPTDGCRGVNSLLGAYVRGGLARREIAKVDAHLESCGECRSLVLELGDIAHGMRAVVAPLIVGLAGLAVVGALPLGGALGGAGGVAGAGAGAAVGAGSTAGTGGAVGAGGASVGTVTGTSTAATGTVGATAAGGASITTGATAGTTAAASGAAATGATTGATSLAVSGVATGSAATAATAGTAAAASAVVGTASVAAAASAVAVATVGVVTVLNALGSGDEPPVASPPAPVTIQGNPWVPPGEQPGDGAVEPADKDVTPSDPTVDPTSPVNLLVTPFAPVADLVVSTAAAPLEPRTTAPLVLTVANTGEATASETVIEVALPDGVDLALPDATVGAAVGGTFGADALPCTAGDADGRTARCTIGTLEPGQSRSGSVPVRAHAGGSYLIGGSVWADGVAPRTLALPPTTVLSYGAELTASTGDAVPVSNPGAAWVPVTVRNTGDQAATAWSVQLSVPAGLRPVTSDGDLTCVPGGGSDGAGAVWTCVAVPGAAPLAPGEQRSVRLRVVADGSAAPGPVSVAAAPQLPGSEHAVGGSTAVTVAQPWAGAAAGTQAVQARCTVVGGVSSASAVVEGTYVNLTDQTLAVRLDAAGGSATASRDVAPGESVTVRVPDGLRVPAGTATWDVATTLGGQTYRTSVPAGPHRAAECYDPRWDVSTSAETTNVDGRLQVRGTLTNTSDEAMRVGMTAAGVTVDQKRLAPGESTTFVAATDRTSLGAGAAEFHLYRWVADGDGDEPAQGVVPAVAPTAPYAAATLAPAAGGPVTLTAAECRFDASADTSWRTVTVPLDNTASTHAVRFAVPGDAAVVGAGATGTLTVSVPWGKRSLAVTADGRDLTTVDVPGFESCATATWPGAVDLDVATRCVDDRAQVVVDVRNGGAVPWRARLAGSGDGSVVEPGSDAALTTTVGGVQADAGSVTVRLARTVEGKELSVERTVDHDAVSCVVIDPQAQLDPGAVEVEKRRWRSTSTRPVTVVLDNTGSSVPQEFTVEGTNGASVATTVPARQSVRADVGTARGRDGATYTVRAGDWSAELAVEPFTGTPGWCADRFRWGGQYEVGDVASWRGANHRYVGRDAGSDDPGRGAGNGRWSGHHGRSAWERVGDCEYR
ncbi:sigma-70 family RNA polymerase sigma factor [Krasilnikoviella flava]|uniref:RNA polymerase sigma factor, sigma-70 family n=1 Tax=Krasilnikoviella flava TaxID=526729 RepID=A0A1T5IRM1_9MICO|nr:sigma-70 family RNA polymerase sigma factor [Krasilnikoviella flava]SKC41755.1 RNA polymerase sigma factor, sigma-70 family [Krasilnikoviella flava]